MDRHCVVMQPGEGPSFWQPKPANGHAEVTLTPASTGQDGPGDKAPEPFARPTDVVAIERAMGMQDTQA